METNIPKVSIIKQAKVTYNIKYDFSTKFIMEKTNNIIEMSVDAIIDCLIKLFFWWFCIYLSYSKNLLNKFFFIVILLYHYFFNNQ